MQCKAPPNLMPYQQEPATGLDRVALFTKHNSSDKEEEEYPLEKKRWLMLTVFTMMLTSTILVQTTFAPIASPVATIYSTSESNVNLLITSGFLCYIIFNIPAVWLLQRKGLKFTFKLCSVAIICATWARYFLLKETGNFSLLLIP